MKNNISKRITILFVLILPFVVNGQTCPDDQLPQDKFVFAENPEGQAPHSTNIIVNQYEAGILYELRKDSDNTLVAGPQPGSIGLFVQGVTETTSYFVIARNPDTGCE